MLSPAQQRHCSQGPAGRRPLRFQAQPRRMSRSMVRPWSTSSLGRRTSTQPVTRSPGCRILGHRAAWDRVATDSGGDALISSPERLGLQPVFPEWTGTLICRCRWLQASRPRGNACLRARLQAHRRRPRAHAPATGDNPASARPRRREDACFRCGFLVWCCPPCSMNGPRVIHPLQ